MRAHVLLFPASLLLASSAFAQTLPYPRTDPGAMSTVQVTAPARAVLIESDQAEKIEGAYAMSNGWRMKVRTGTRYIDATIDRQKPLRLFAVAPYQFSSPDGNVTMEFNRGDWGEDMLMSYVPDPRLADVAVLSAQR